MNKEQLISEVLLLPSAAIDYYVSKNLAMLFPDQALIEGDGGYFDVEGYANAKLCTLTRKTFTYNQMSTHWIPPAREVLHWNYGSMSVEIVKGAVDPTDQEPVPPENRQETHDRVKKAWLEVLWQGHSLDVLLLHLESDHFPRIQHWILADTQEIARGFFSAVCQWNMQIRREVLVFDGGCWQKDPFLFEDIKSATFDNLILSSNLKQEIRDDLEQFFASRVLYEEHDVPWKRGILFVGPAGNGKTHAVKALINTLEQPCLYVKSFRAPQTHGADEINIRQVFDRARRVAPCVLVLEDLDSLITPQNRSFFLNELDGFAANIGIVTLATTNHPERLDPAIIDRPSRFDRKYPFSLPELPERLAYITLWNDSLKPSLKLSQEGLTKISTSTEGFSFAYLKELFLSSKMRWIANPQQGPMEVVMTGQVDTLREQMSSLSAFPDVDTTVANEQAIPPGFHAMMSARMRLTGGEGHF
jgi:hypothetical protein